MLTSLVTLHNLCPGLSIAYATRTVLWLEGLSSVETTVDTTHFGLLSSQSVSDQTKDAFSFLAGLAFENHVAFGIFNGLVFASAGPIIDIKLVTGINWTTFQHTRPNHWDKHWQRSLDTANLLDSVSIVKPCCTSRKAETIKSPSSAPKLLFPR